MKTRWPRVIPFACLLTLTLALGAGCGDGGGTGTAKVDVPAQIQALKSPDANVRTEAATQLAAAGPKAAPAVSALVEALKDSDALVRRLAAYALMEIGPAAAASAVPAITEAMAKERDLPAQQQMVNSLRILDPKKAGDVQLKNVTR